MGLRVRSSRFLTVRTFAAVTMIDLRAIPNSSTIRNNPIVPGGNRRSSVRVILEDRDARYGR